MSAVRGSVEPRDRPYFGLDYYQEKFGAWFFGRETEGSKIITNLRAARLTLLHAGSGVGKTSLLRAGVAWRMRNLANDSLARRGTARFIPVVFSSWKDDPVLELTGAIRTAIGPYLAGRPPPEVPPGRLDAAIAAASDAVNAGLLIMLDQFEEYFLYRTREPAPGRFADELARCINRANLRANFLIAIREDAYAGLGELFKGRIANVYGNYLHVEYLDRAYAETAIRAPLDIYNGQPGVEQVKIEDELVAAVLDQVRAIDDDMPPGEAAAADGGGRVATPLLQLVMETLWERERAQGSHELRLSTLQDLRGVGMIVEAHLGKALSTLGRGERQTAIDVFGHLVTPSGGKIAESVPDLAQVTGHSEAQVGSVLERLDHERIVRPVPAAPGHDPVRYRRYEIFHDVLAPAVNRTIAVREEQRRTRRFRRSTALVAALLIVVLAVAGWSAFLWHAHINKLATESRQLAAEADVNLARDPELSALLALQALRVQHTTQAEDALRAALPELQTVRTLQDRTAVHSAVFDPADANKVASADQNGVASIWNVKTGARMSLPGSAATGTADTVAFNPAGTEVAVGYEDGTVALFDARSGRELRSASVAGSPVINNVGFLGGTGELAIATSNGLFLWTPSTGAPCCHRLSGTPTASISTALHNPREFAVASTDGVVVWNVAGTPWSRVISSYSATDAAVSPDGSEVATVDNNGNVIVYDAATFDKQLAFFGPGEAFAWKVAYSPDGKQIVAGYASGNVRVWDRPAHFELMLLAGSPKVTGVNFSPDSSELVTASDDGTIRVWHAQPRELRAKFTSPPNRSRPAPVVWAAGYISSRMITLDDYGRVYVFTPGGDQQTVISPHVQVDSMDWNQAGTKIVTASSNGTVDVWQASGSNYTPVSLRSPINLNQAGSVAMSPDGSRFAIVTGNYHTVQVRSAETGGLQQTLSAKQLIGYIAFSPNGRQIVAGDDLGKVEVWNNGAANPQILGRHGQPITDIAFSQDGNKYVTAYFYGRMVNVWGAPDGRLLKQIVACPSYRASFSPDGSKIVVACQGGTLQVFDAVTGRTLTTLQATYAGAVMDAAFSPDGKSIVAAIDAGYFGDVQVWNSELTTPSLPALEELAKQRITRQFTQAERSTYLEGIG